MSNSFFQDASPFSCLSSSSNHSFQAKVKHNNNEYSQSFLSLVFFFLIFLEKRRVPFTQTDPCLITVVVPKMMMMLSD